MKEQEIEVKNTMGDQVNEAKWRKRMRTTLIIEAESDAGFEDALKHAIAVAREHVIGMSFSLPKSDGCPRVECRTSQVRKSK